MAFAPAVKQEFDGTVVRETALREHFVLQKPLRLWSLFWSQLLHKTNGRTKISFEARFHTYKVYFNRPKRKKPADGASFNAKKTNIEKSQQHSVSEPINFEKSVENIDWKSSSDGIESKHVQSEGLVETEIKTGNINLVKGWRNVMFTWEMAN